MDNIFDAFPSKYLKASDLSGDTPVAIENVVIEDVGGKNNPADQKPVVRFRGMTKGVALNKTNATTIAEPYGTNPNGWTGKQVTLYPTSTEFQGRTMPCIRVRVPGTTTQVVSGAINAADVEADVNM